MDLKTTYTHLIAAAALAAGCAASAPAQTITDYYPANSKLAEGRWAKVKVEATGMHIISDADLRSLGFSNPEKVHVYGLGGRDTGFGLGMTHGRPNDLPLLPSVRTAKGIVFFAADHFTWKPAARNSRTPYSHTIHPYSDATYYFISDRDTEAEDLKTSSFTARGEGSNPLEEFTDRLVHEKDLEHCGESGVTLLGEDFRMQKAQTFRLEMPGMTDGQAMVSVRFGAKTTGGSSTLAFKANGTELPATADDRIPACTSGLFVSFANSIKEVEGLDGKLDLGIDYTYSGALFQARLDYIEAFWSRAMRLDAGELYFFGNYSQGDAPKISGCGEQTVIWDVTDPARQMKVEYELADGKALFSLRTNGYREFVAFNPEEVTRAARPAGRVDNQNIHGLDTPDMVIITYPEYRSGAERIGRLHEEVDGMRVHVLDADKIYNEFSGGKPDVGAFRKMLKMWHDRGADAEGHKLGYCLLMGKPSYDNKGVSSAVKSAGYRPMLIYQSNSGYSEKTSYSNDDYIGMLNDVADAQFMINRARCTIPVGRIPVTDASESILMAEKIEKYVKNPEYGPWRSKVMIIADDDDAAEHLDQAQKVYNSMRSNGNGKSFVYDRLYLDSYRRVITGVGPTYPQCTERMMRNYNEGVLVTNYIGHASPTGWGHEHLWEWKDIISMTNKRLTFMYAATCGFAYWDLPSMSGAEHLMLNPESGIIGMMGATRTVYISMNGVLNNFTAQDFFARDEEGHALRFGDIYIKGKNKYTADTNKLRYAFMGDPAIRIPSPEFGVEVEKINNITLDGLSDSNLPQIPALGTMSIEGRITDRKGNFDEGFNGQVTLQIYDAERVITTYGQGDDGKSVSYNDRKTRLTTANAKVENGRWRTQLTLPSEIEGNYSPAMIAAYAWDGEGREANGACDRFYVYGYNYDAPTDTVGPKIENFYVNNPNFENGGLVSSNPVVFARISDESGVNISESGIGHSLTLTIDGSIIHSDLNESFTVDPDDTGAGQLMYTLQDLTPGRHSLMLTAWDNAGNVSKSSLDINVGAALEPVIYGVNAWSAAGESMVFDILLDRPNSDMKCSIGIYDLLGRRIWEHEMDARTGTSASVSATWDMTDGSGARVPRGIYIYRVRAEAPDGAYSTMSKKIAVSAK
ncbi:MAG: type IX secretion system sortase PorU [Candidatus Amulumruptor caecigallinarius]|nr:type IX secretion system sortase PorU [Candidatus Amulumruptor caecigallinarius]